MKTAVNFYVRRFLYFLMAFFFCFPFIDIFGVWAGYNQPYAFVAACLLFPFALYYCSIVSPGYHFLYVFLFFMIGVILFFLTCYPYVGAQEYKYLYTYVSLPIVFVSSFVAINSEKKFLATIFEYASIAWLFVALIQYFYDPNFAIKYVGLLGERGSDIVSSGRGVLSLAPEPTHYGFHMLFMAAAILLLGGRIFFSYLCVFQMIFLSLSSSAILVLVLAFLLSLLFSRRIKKSYIVATFSFALLACSLILFADDTRVFAILSSILRDPSQALAVDASVNYRLGGLFSSFDYIVESLFYPHGLSHEQWLFTSKEITNNNRWLLGLSEAGVPSGVGVLLYQGGFLIVAPLFFIWSIFFTLKFDSGFSRVVILTIPLILLFQYYLSSPIFVFVYAAAVFVLRGKRVRRYRSS